MKQFLFATLLFITQVGNGQNLAFFQNQFNKGKDKFKEADYQTAMDLLLPITIDNIENPYSKVACFYYALSSFKSTKYDAAKNMLIQIQLKYGTWQNDEVNYLLGNVYFELKEFDKALSFLNKIEDVKVKEDARKMKIFYFNKFKDPVFLKPIYLRNPKEKEVAEILKFKLKDSKQLADIKLVEEIHSFLRTENKYLDTGSIKKDKYKVAVLLPFQLLAISVRNENSDNRFVYDFMQGIRIALDSLNRQQQSIELYLYDCDKDTTKLLKVLNLPEMSAMDVIIGPIYQNLTSAAAAFAKSREIPIISPLSVTNKVAGQNNFYFHHKPSIETQAKKAALYMAMNIFPANAIILYGKNSRDSISAKNCKLTLEEKGVKIKQYKTVDKNNAININKIIGNKTIDSLGAIFVFCGEQLVATNLITTLAVINSQVPLFVAADWMNFESFNYDQYQKHNVHFILPVLYSQNDTLNNQFINQYFDKFNIVPNEYVYLGYDLMRWAGLNLLESGKINAEIVALKGFQPGVWTTGVDYSNSSDNQIVPIVKFEDFLLKQVNK